MNNLSCNECVKTDNHCCLADIPHSVPDAIYYKYRANQLGIECLIVPHPKADHHVVLVQRHMENTDITEHSCIFMKDNRCLIYEDRPTICRSYGTKAMPCRYTDTKYTTEFEIGKLTKEDIHKLDGATNMNNLFESIMNGTLK